MDLTPPTSGGKEEKKNAGQPSMRVVDDIDYDEAGPESKVKEDVKGNVKGDVPSPFQTPGQSFSSELPDGRPAPRTVHPSQASVRIDGGRKGGIHRDGHKDRRGDCQARQGGVGFCLAAGGGKEVPLCRTS